MNRRFLKLFLHGTLAATSLLSQGACRGDEADNDQGGSDGGMALVGCPVGQGTSLTVCEIKNDGNPRQPALEDVIEVADVVVTTAPFSVTQTATSGLNGFYVQDQQSTPDLAQRYSGIIVTFFADSATALPNRGDVIRITGTLLDFGRQGQTNRRKEIRLGSFTAEGSATPRAQAIANPQSVASSGTDAAAYEGVLVEVRNVTVEQTEVRGPESGQIFGAFEVTGGLVVRNTLTGIQSTQGEMFNRLAGILRVGTAPFDFDVFALTPRDGSDLDASSMAIRSLEDLQNPMASGRPSLCTQTGGINTRMGTCPRVDISDVVVTAVRRQFDGDLLVWVQDDSLMDGRYAGAFMFNPRVDGMAMPAVGDRVSVRGVGVLFNNGMQIGDATISISSSFGQPPAPTVVPSANLGMPNLINGEVTNPYEGVLVRIENVMVTNRCIESSGDRGYFEVTGGAIIGGDFDYAYNGDRAAGSGNPPDCSAMSRTMDMRAVGDSFASITGVMAYSFGQYRLNPRGDDDLVRN